MVAVWEGAAGVESITGVELPQDECSITALLAADGPSGRVAFTLKLKLHQSYPRKKRCVLRTPTSSAAPPAPRTPPPLCRGAVVEKNADVMPLRKGCLMGRGAAGRGVKW